MPQVVRLNDYCSGHSCWPTRPTITASEDVFVNGRGAHRKTDALAVHCCGLSCHGGTTVQGSPNVFVNGLPIARITDKVDCGSVLLTGSENVFANG